MNSSSPPAPLLEVRRISKRFPGVRALRDVSMRVEQGEVLAVIGENGAGKSTLMKILAGVQTPDEGQILVNGEQVSIHSVRAAESLGIALIHQELNLCENLDVGANIFLGREPRVLSLIDRAAIRKQSAELLRQVGLDCEPGRLVGTLSIGRQQMVEIAKALSVNARLLIMDEPTSSLSTGEVAKLFAVIRDLRRRGVSVVYISHRLGEVKEVADRVVVLRDGENAGELKREEIDHDRMVNLMVGRDISQFHARTAHTPGDVVLEAHDLVIPGQRGQRINFQLRQGEIVGVAGLVGAGRTELLDVLFGVRRPESGRILVAGRPVVFSEPRDAIRAGLALAPEDRKAQGLVLQMTVRENATLAALWRGHMLGMRIPGFERNVAGEMIAKLRIKTPSDKQIVQFLSGGNQQKVVLGKWLALRPKVLLLDEPTRGIDIGAKREIYELMESLAQQGVAILFVSSEMEEVLGMSDRTLVMHEGRIAGELARHELTEEAVMQLATGRGRAA